MFRTPLHISNSSWPAPSAFSGCCCRSKNTWLSRESMSGTCLTQGDTLWSTRWERVLFCFVIYLHANNSPSASKKRNSLLQTCECALSCVPTACCINCGRWREESFSYFSLWIADWLVNHGVQHFISLVDVAHVFHHEPPQVLVEVWERSESPLQELCVLGVQQRGDEDEEIREVGIEVSLQVSGQLHHQAGGRKKSQTSAKRSTGNTKTDFISLPEV